MGKSKLVVSFGDTKFADSINFQYNEVGTPVTYYTDTAASIVAATQFLPFAGSNFENNYNVSQVGGAIYIEAKLDGSEYDFGTVVASTTNGSSISITRVPYTPPALPCDLDFLTPKTSIVNDTNASGVGKITINSASSHTQTYAIQKVGGVKTDYQASNVFPGLSAGTYTVFVTDANNCQITSANHEVKNDPCSISLNITQVTHETELDLNNGSVQSIANSSVEGSITYMLDGNLPQDNGSYSNIPPGLHYITVTDLAGCTVSGNFTINEAAPPPVPVECFDPLIFVSEVLPYRFIIKKCNEDDEVEVLFNDIENCAYDNDCYYQLASCNDVITLQIYYLDEEFKTVPTLKIVDLYTDAVIGTVDFTSIGEGYYKIEKNISEISNICEKRVYLLIKSKSATSSTEYFTHAKSEAIYISNYHNCNLLLEYWNNSNYNGVLYENTSFVNKMRLEAVLEVVDYPQIIDVYKKSNKVRIKLREEISEEWELEVNYSPSYVHKKIALALSHDNVKIGNVLLIKEDAYSFDKSKTSALSKGSGKLSTKEYLSKNLIK